MPSQFLQTQIAHRSGSAFRIYMGGHAIVAWYIAMTDTRSLMHAVASRGEGAALIWLLMLLGACALVDAIINDLAPECLHWRRALKQRHFILTGMAFCYLAQIYVAFCSQQSTGLLLYYLWNAGVIVFAAYLDAHQRSKDASCATA